MKSAEDVSSSDTESSTDEMDDVHRPKREVGWCGAGIKTQGRNNAHRAQISWPPDPSSTSNFSWRNLRPVRPGNPRLGNKMQLFSKTKHFLGIYPDGTVRGTKDDNDLHTHLEIVSTYHPGDVKIQGILTKLFVAMDDKGRLYAEADPTEDAAIFIESFQGHYNTYLSRKYAHLGWYLGIKKSGKYKKGPKTAPWQKAVKFLPRRTKFE